MDQASLGSIEKILVFSSTPDVASDNFVVPILAAPLAELPHRAMEMGFDGIEFLPDPDDIPSPETLSKAITSAGAHVGVINSGRLMTHGYALLHYDAEVRRKSVEVYKRLIDLGGAVGARIGLGMARGDAAVTAKQPDLAGIMRDVFEDIAAHAEAAGTSVMLEPADPGYVAAILRVSEAAAMARSINSPGFRIMLDTYQLNAVENSVADGFEQAQGLASHIHLYDPLHWPPGVRDPADRMDWDQVRKSMQVTGFRGTGSTVLAPQGDVVAAAKASLAFLRDLMAMEAA